MKHLCFILLLTLSGQMAFAQVPYFKKYSLGESFSRASVQLAYEDRNSSLWFGAREGLFHFDGIDFKPYLKEDSTSNHVNSIFRDRSDRLWIGYQDGSIYHLTGQQLKRWQPEEGTPVVPIVGFEQDDSGRIWIATYGEGLYYYENGRLQNIDEADGLSGNDIYEIIRDGANRIWTGTDNGISICSLVNGEKKVDHLSRKDGLPDDIVRTLHADDKGNVWIGTYGGGFCMYNTVTGQIEMPFPSWQECIITSLELFEGKELWIGTELKGVWRYDLEENVVRPLPGLDRDKIYDLHKDIEGNIWVVSHMNQICRANRQFEFIANELDNIQAVTADDNNHIWVGTPDGLFMHKVLEDGKSHFIEHLKQYQLNVISLWEDDYGNILVGTFDKGLFCYDPFTGRVRNFTEKDGLTNDNILSIDGVDNHVWLATLGGATQMTFRHDPLSGKSVQIKNFNQESGLGTNFIYKVFVDSKKRTWFGTDGKGISVLENGIIRNYPVAVHHHNGIKEQTELQTVYAITEDKNGNIWLSTNRNGIFEFDGENFTHLAVKEGIRDLEITSLISDEQGKILIIHPSGIDVLTPESRHLIYYDKEVGIQQLNPHLNAVCQDNYGNIWIGAKQTLIKYTALSEQFEIHPRTLINSVSVFLEPIDFQHVNCFEHKQNNLVFSYMGLWYTDPYTVKYRYQLEGYDRSWIESRDRQATYSNLPPGNYTFKVTSTENDAWSDEPVASYSFEILQPLWMRWWFIVLAMLTIAGLFYWYIRARDQRLQRVNLLERKKAESELSALKAQINPHFLFNSFNTLITVIEEDPDIAVEYVEKMSDFYRSMLQLRDREVISLQEEIELVKNYTYLLQKRYGNNFRLHIHINGDVAYIVPLTLQILVENAVKHNIISKSKPLTVEISRESEDYISIVNNLQPKIRKEKSTRFGLESLTRRYEMLVNKKVKIYESASEFRISIPILK